MATNMRMSKNQQKCTRNIRMQQTNKNHKNVRMPKTKEKIANNMRIPKTIKFRKV